MPNFYHSFWSCPRLDKFTNIEFEKVEFLTLLLGILELKKKGKINLITDRRGLEFFENVGISEFYDNIELHLDFLYKEADPTYFWGAGKIFAQHFIPAGDVLVDLDLVLMNLPEISSDKLLVSNFEFLKFDSYCNNVRDFGDFFPSCLWNWGYPALNTAILRFPNESLKHFYVSCAMDFINKCSKFDLSKESAKFHSLFVEQRLLGMIAGRTGTPVFSLGELDDSLGQIKPNSNFIHLWGSKRLYQKSKRAQNVASNYLIEKIKLFKNMRINEILEKNFSQSSDDTSQPTNILCNLNQSKRIKEIEGKIRIYDPNFPVFRYAEENEEIFDIEKLKPEENSKFKIE